MLHLIRERGNICNQLHLPAQSGNNEVLTAMRRGYTVEAYRELVDHVLDLVPGLLSYMLSFEELEYCFAYVSGLVY